jgi:NhaC family Na+:H+ antiporter
MHSVGNESQDRATKEPSYLDAVTPLIVLTVLVGGSVALFGLDAMSGPVQVAMMMSAMVASIIILKNGHNWADIEEASRRGVSSVVSAIFILLAVGALIGTWNMAGTIPHELGDSPFEIVGFLFASPISSMSRPRK